MKRTGGEVPLEAVPGPERAIDVRAVSLAAGRARLPAVIAIPEACRGWVVSASSDGARKNGSLSSRIHARLHEEKLATLEIDLLEPPEAEDAFIRFDIPLLAKRLLAATEWLSHTRQPSSDRVAYLAMGNAAGAALWGAVRGGFQPASVVSLSGRPHLAEPFLGDVACPTLLLVEGDDAQLLHMNHQAEHRLSCPKKLVSVAGRTQREKKAGLRTLSHEAVEWISANMKAPAAGAASLLSLVRGGFGPRARRQWLASLAFLFVSLVFPHSARTDEEGSSPELKEKSPSLR